MTRPAVPCRVDRAQQPEQLSRQPHWAEWRASGELSTGSRKEKKSRRCCYSANMEGYNNSYQNGSTAKETEFQRLAQNIGTNIQKIQQNGGSLEPGVQLSFMYSISAVSSMQRMITQIGTAQDNQQLQNQL